MTSERPYRKALPKETAIREIVKNAGTQFDPQVVRFFLEVLEEKKEKPRFRAAFYHFYLQHFMARPKASAANMAL